MKKHWLRTIGTLCFSITCASLLAGCDDTPGPGPVEDLTSLTLTVNGGTPLEGGAVGFEVGGTGTVTVTNQDGEEVTSGLSFSTRDSAVLSVNSMTGAFSCSQPGITDLIVTSSTNVTVIDSVSIEVTGVGATGTFNYANNSIEDRVEILGKLEKYAQDNYLTGIPFCGDGQSVMYSSRVNFPYENYITGYGFGIVEYGSLDAEGTNGKLAGITDKEFPDYYHTFIAENPSSVADWNSNSTSTSSISGYMSSGYFTTELNQNWSDYQYANFLADDSNTNWEALDASSGSNPTATTFKLYVKTEGVKYATKSTNPDFAKYNGQEVKLEDYLTPFMVLLTQQHNLFRGAEMIDENYARPILGCAEYWNATADGMDVDLFKQMSADGTLGVAVGTDEGGDYIQLTFGQRLPVSTAQSNLSLDYWSPLPLEFFTESLAKYVKAAGDVTGTNNVGRLYGTFNSDRSISPVDTSLTLGAYVVSAYTDSYVVLEKNTNYLLKTDSYGRELNRIPGIYIHILEGQTQDPETAFREFIAERLDSVTIPSTQINAYRNDPRTKEIPETTTWKVNINATTQDLWVSLFGEQGSVYQTNRSNYWEVKPIMSNRHFLDGLYFSIDRDTFASSNNYSASQCYLSDAYIFQGAGENGEDLIYNETEAHAAAIADRYPETFGYNYEAARAMFKLAIQEEVEAGHYSYGTAENPTVITLQAKWMTTSSMNTMGVPIVEYMERAFNSVDPRIQLDIVNSVAGATSDAMYDALEQGQFDLGMGAITGMQIYPMEFMQVLCSDNRSGFVLNWSVDTGVNDGTLYYDGKTWSFDALWEAATGQLTSAINGVATDFQPFYISSANEGRGTRNEADQSMTYTLNYRIVLEQGIQVRTGRVEILDSATLGSFYAISDAEAEGLVTNWTQDAVTADDGTVTVTGSLRVVITAEFDAPWSDFGNTSRNYDYQATVNVYIEVADSVNGGITYEYPIQFDRLATYSR